MVLAEQQTIREISNLGKPYIVLLNSARPYSAETVAMANELSNQYKVKVIPVNADQLRKEDITQILGELLMEFPIAQVNFDIPKWTEAVGLEDEMKCALVEVAAQIMDQTNLVRDIYSMDVPICEYIDRLRVEGIELDTGNVNIQISVIDSYYYQMLSKLMSTTIENEYQFMNVVKDMEQ